jgi:hypothetical protein
VHKMTISKTLILLGSWASDADSRAMMAAEPLAVVRSAEQSRLYRGMAEAIREAIAAQVPLPAIIPAKRAARKPAAKAKPLNALEFWAMHAEAVAAIKAEYGERWGVASPFGATELVAVPACWRKFKTERGTILQWHRDQRMPAARFWPTGELPAELVITPDYQRHPFQPVDRYAATRQMFARVIGDRRRWHEKGSDGWEKCSDFARGLLAELRGMVRPVPVVITPTVRDAAWHEAHGYILVGKDWVNRLGYLAGLAQAEGAVIERECKRLAALERACLSYGPQPLHPFADIADDIELAEAAD